MESSYPITLLIHDGELADVCALLGDIGATFVERRGDPTEGDRQSVWDLVIATPKRMLEFDVEEADIKPIRIVILEEAGRTLRAILQRERVELMVRRPVHPAALRLLIVHALYRGPEKRNTMRVSIGAAVRFRSGWRRRRGILAELSGSGCRLLSRHPVKRGERITLYLTADLTGRTPLTLCGRVVRRRPLPDERLGADAIAVSFDALAAASAKRLQQVVRRYAGGPAALPPSAAKQFAATAPASRDAPGSRHREQEAAAEAVERRPPQGATVAAGGERREIRVDVRRSYSRRVIALGDDVTRVLIGRDLSVGGMRVDPHPTLSMGDKLRVALHADGVEQPLVVSAQVCRDDGEQGLALQFRDLSTDAEKSLGRMVESLPCIVMRDGNGEGERVVVSEILGCDRG